MFKEKVIVICADPRTTQALAHGIVTSDGGPRRDTTYHFYKAPLEETSRKLKQKYRNGAAKPGIFPVTRREHESLPFYTESMATRLWGSKISFIGVGAAALHPVREASDIVEFRTGTAVGKSLITDDPHPDNARLAASHGMTLFAPFWHDHYALQGEKRLNLIRLDAMPRVNLQKSRSTDYHNFLSTTARENSVRHLLRSYGKFAFVVLNPHIAQAEARKRGEDFGLRMAEENPQGSTNLLLAHGNPGGGDAAQRAMNAFAAGYWHAQMTETFIARLPFERDLSYSLANIGPMLLQKYQHKCIAFVSGADEHAGGVKPRDPVRQIMETLDLTHRRGVIRRPASVLSL